MRDMPNASTANDPINDLAEAAAQYERYLEISGVTSVASISQKREHSAPLPAPMTITIG